MKKYEQNMIWPDPGSNQWIEKINALNSRKDSNNERLLSVTFDHQIRKTRPYVCKVKFQLKT